MDQAPNSCRQPAAIAVRTLDVLSTFPCPAQGREVPPTGAACRPGVQIFAVGTTQPIQAGQQLTDELIVVIQLGGDPSTTASDCVSSAFSNGGAKRRCTEIA